MRIPAWLFIGLLAACPLIASDNPFPKAPSEVEEVLRSRVTEFYTYFQQRKYRKAEALIDEESRDYFYASSKKPILGFELSSMEFQDDFRQANVLVNVMIMLPMMGPKPVPFPLTGTWRWVEDNWYMHMEGNKPGTIKQGPFGPMRIAPDAALSGGRWTSPGVAVAFGGGSEEIPATDVQGGADGTALPGRHCRADHEIGSIYQPRTCPPECHGYGRDPYPARTADRV